MISCILAIQMIYDGDLKNIIEVQKNQLARESHLNLFITKLIFPKKTQNIEKAN